MVAFACLSFGASPIADARESGEKMYLAIEVNNVLCGYSVINVSDSLYRDKHFKFMEQSAYINLHMLGRDITQHQRFTYLIDPTNGNFVYHDSYHQQGDTEMRSRQVVEGDSLMVSTGGGRTAVYVPANTILPNTQYYPYLLVDFSKKGIREKTYPVYDLRSGKISSKTYSRLGEGPLDLAGDAYQAIVFQESDPEQGTGLKLWIDKKTGIRLRMEIPQRLTMYLTDASVMSRIKTGNWDDLLFVKTNTNIKDLHAITSMKVRIDLGTEPKSTVEDLIVPGQIFSGTVENGQIRGICEIAHKRYDGENAPPFPFQAAPHDKIGPFLEASNTIESDDPVLVEKAWEITEGSSNAWDAVCRLSRWADDHIDGAILDGSARDTFDRRSGLCGAQSNLMAALCRAASIPARVVWGCIYIPKDGGSFGHHAWNEVYMGAAGWIPIDVTIHETDYVDSGHIRLGELKTLRTNIDFREIEILEYATEGKAAQVF
jgi:hypothetical protein